MSAVNLRADCPDQEQLQALLSDTDVVVAPELDQHIENCLQCQARLDALTDSMADQSLTDGQKDLWNKIIAQPGLAGSTAPQNQATTMQGIRQSDAIVFPNIPGYRVLNQLAVGGMGAVYKARHVALNRNVAIKVMRPTQDPQLVARFEREMSAVGLLSHPNIVQAFDAGEVDGIPYLVMEHLDGEDLHQVLKKQSSGIHLSAEDSDELSVVMICRHIRDVALALQAAHEKGLVHRDVKPSNVMLTSDGTVKLLDLGLASVQVDDFTDGAITDVLTIMGSLDYMAPEQGRDARVADARSDVYSLGCTLFALLTGQAPFSGDQFRGASQKLLAHACEPRPHAGNLNSRIPQRLSLLIQRMMSIEPKDRPQSAGEVAELLTVHCGDGYDEPPKRRFGTVAMAGFGAALVLLFVITFSLSDGTAISLETDKAAAETSINDTGAMAAVRMPSVDTTPAAPSADNDGSTVNMQGSRFSATWPPDAPDFAVIPFDAEQAIRHQQEWADYVELPVVQRNSLGMPMRLVPPGEFEMGMRGEQVEALLNRWEEETGKPQTGEDAVWRQMAKRHKVRLSKPILVSQHEVTFGNYQALTGEDLIRNLERRDSDDTESTDISRCPVQTTWLDAVRFCNLLSDAEDLPAFYTISDDGVVELNGGSGYRLLTEAEWEFACRSGSDDAFWTDGVHHELHHYAAVTTTVPDSDFVQPAVGTKAPNGFGLQDMLSIPEDWCYDWFDRDWYEKSPTLDPIGPPMADRHSSRGAGRYLMPFQVGAAIRAAGEQHPVSERNAIRVCRSVGERKAMAPMPGPTEETPVPLLLSAAIIDQSAHPQLIRTLDGLQNPVTAFQFGPQSDVAYAIENLGRVLKWNLSDGTHETIFRFESERIGQAMEVSPDGDHLYFGGTSGFTKLNLDTRECEWTYEGDSFKWATNVPGHDLIAVGQVHAITILNTSTGEVVQQVRLASEHRARFTRDGQRMIARLRRPQVAAIFDRSGSELSLTTFTDENFEADYVEMTQDEKFVIAIDGHKFVMWDVETGDIVEKGHCRHLKPQVFIEPVGDTGMFLTCRGILRNQLTLWHPMTDREDEDIVIAVPPLYRFDVSPDGQTVLTSDFETDRGIWGGTVRLWRMP
ncbi:bifunctional serine/threonine-protein kinase/formylglycine-generating enzyme family protein [Fuerstiella marisgermanici]|uniref:Serine/threonine-protein kinase StkP n=1 Tax=Fuerstiella marisgermanici TaxID=1891926 RepID=A0A1P8WDA5_9PLAN|nr:bifunctional serine/threonine-protein kinase/formylglycine-generating enzyme family protein [Fuerstiella marisgermanici]APZ92058.1 Serine/threonine-protein kinase StkP [Fuerstiella marisgermanici]